MVGILSKEKNVGEKNSRKSNRKKGKKNNRNIMVKEK
jgi:hypothetical protein